MLGLGVAKNRIIGVAKNSIILPKQDKGGSEGEMEEEVKVLELYEIHYSDLLLLSSSSSSSSCCGEDERLDRIKKSIIETLGPNGAGLLCITRVPNASLLRRNLLPLARKLALLRHDTRKHLLKKHNLGTDVSLKNPDRNVSSFAMQLNYAEALESVLCKTRNYDIHPKSNSGPTRLDVDEVEIFRDDEFNNLSSVFKELGYCMMELGLRLAQLCDELIGDHELERSLLESGTAKGRLIHYHSALDNILLRDTGKNRKGSTKNQANSRMEQEHCLRNEQNQYQGPYFFKNGHKIKSFGNHTDLWQQWHYDYGIFTVLTAPMFLAQSNLSEEIATDQSSVLCDQEFPYPNGYSYLQIFDPNKNAVFMVKTSPESFIIQVGESADILSKGKFRSTLHCVSRPAMLENVSRETFVVFLQPAWSKRFSISDYNMEDNATGYLSNKGSADVNHHSNKSAQDFHKIIPPLSSRLKDGMTFAEFSRETTKQYYGGSGLQSNR